MNRQTDRSIFGTVYLLIILFRLNYTYTLGLLVKDHSSNDLLKEKKKFLLPTRKAKAEWVKR